MRILWVTNIPIGKQCELINSFPNTGGWMAGTLEEIKGKSSIELFVVTSWPIKTMKEIKEENILYAVLPGGLPIKYKPYKKRNLEEWRNVVHNFKPDLIHIHGTEFSLGLSLIKSCPNENYVISLQGLCRIYERYYYAGIEIRNILKNVTLRDIIRQDTIFQARIKLRKRGKLESQYISAINHVMGRTSWDYVHSLVVNKNICYYNCNENLRNEFYFMRWQLSKIRRHSIFLSQMELPYKGIHLAIKAFHLLLQDYCDLEVYIAGDNITRTETLNQRIKLTGYSKYLKSLIKKYSLEKHISFLGPVNSQRMAESMAKSHVFVCPSSIENSPNSLCEAQLVGLPVVASYVGGIPDLVKHEETGLLYRFEEFEMLSYSIKRIFENDDLALSLSKCSRDVAIRRHNRTNNVQNLISIYNKIILTQH